MLKKEIGFAGGGWGAVAAAKSLKKFFILHYFSNDEDVINELSDQEKNKQVSRLADLTNEVVIFAGYMSIVGDEFISKHTVINIHYSLLPKYRGLHSTAWAIMNGEEELGLSIHLMTSFIDDGAIIHQKAFRNDNNSTATHYILMMNEYIGVNLGEIIFKYTNRKITAIPQDKKKASWVGKRSEKHNVIDFNQDSKYMQRLFRVLNPPYLFPQILYKGLIYKVKKIEFQYSSTKTDVGRILNIDDDGLWVKNKDGYIILKEIFDQKNKFVNYSLFKIGHYLND